ncbi:MAG: 4Fe-4S dicluster domain-containing protein [Bacteroidales bacterium]|nr:4Fe-4S dicluster domain-containing protein [Bacteroidales bacterium]MBN2698410.1 4Fe-4S dicluster domain-containing protein [Bacteroidales bacterium]
MAKVNPDFSVELKKFGGFDLNACYNCGNCTAVCSLSTEENSIPRKMVRYSVLGLEDELKVSIDPWLCYYCGECSETCPQDANPGELMMSLRRYLTSKYDWTGFSGLLYRNMSAYVISFLLIIIGIAGLSISNVFSQEEWLHYGHYLEMLAIAIVFAFILLPNIIRMWILMVWNKEKKFSIRKHFLSLDVLFIHMFTQKRSLSCKDDRDNKVWWFEHFILVLSYLLLLFTTVFLNWFNTENMGIIVLGYIFSGIIFVVTIDFILRRIKKKKEKSTFSHPSDWFFVIWLMLMGFSAFIVRMLIDFSVLEKYFWVYLFHITVLIQWAIIIVPFGKWTHFLYRPFAIYFNNIVQDTKK